MYERGEGVVKDSVEAKKWYHRAANCEKAASKLEHLICNESGLSQLHANFLWAYSLNFSQAANPKEFYEKIEAWGASIRDKCDQADCLKRAYQERLKELS